MQDAQTLPPITVLDVRTGNILDLRNDEAKLQIAIGAAIATVPSDLGLAELWVAELRSRVMAEAAQQGHINDVPAFEEYETWCAESGFHALPVKTENLVLYLLLMAAAEMATHVLLAKARSIARIHELSRHPPRHLIRHATDSFYRAIKFAKAAMQEPNITEADRCAPQKAIEMFPDGVVPLRWGGM